MAFLAPLAVKAAPYLIKGGMALGGSLLSNKLSKAKPTPEETAAIGQTTAAQKLGMDTAQGLIPQSQNLFQMGQSAFNPVINYWSSLLSGNKGAVTSAMAPDIFRIGQGYDAARTTSNALNPRGGPSAEFNAELPFQQQRDVTTLLQGARPKAAEGLLGAGSATSNAGSSMLSNAIQSLYQSTAAGRDILNYQQKQREHEQERGKSMGSTLFTIMEKFGFPAIDKLFAGGGSGGGGLVPPSREVR